MTQKRRLQAVVYARMRELGFDTLKDLAKATPIDYSVLWQAVNGRRMPRTDTLTRIAAALRLEPHVLVDALAEQPPEPVRPSEAEERLVDRLSRLEQAVAALTVELRRQREGGGPTGGR